MLWRRYKKCTISVFVDAGFQRFLLWRRQCHHARGSKAHQSHANGGKNKMNESRKIIIIDETNDLDLVFCCKYSTTYFIFFSEYDLWTLPCHRTLTHFHHSNHFSFGSGSLLNVEFFFAVVLPFSFAVLVDLWSRTRACTLVCHRQIIQLTEWSSLKYANDFFVFRIEKRI